MIGFYNYVHLYHNSNMMYIWKRILRERLKKKLKLAIIRMLKTMIIDVANSTREIEEEMPTPNKSRRSQLLSDNEDLDEELTNDE